MSWADETPALKGLDVASRKRLGALGPIDAPKGTVLFQPGDAVKGYVIILKGRIGVHLIGPTGREILLYDVEPGQSCIQSTLGLFGGEDYSAEAVAETDVTAVILPRALFFDLLDNAPAFRRMVFAAFAGRMQKVMHILEHVAFLKVEARLAHHLLARADEGGHVAATQSDLARAIGSAREVISRRLDALARRGAVRSERGRIEILDRPMLNRIARDA